MVRDYSTNGGHLPGDELIEGPHKTVTKKWQGYPPENLNVLGKPMPALPEVSIPRFTGKAQYASRVWFPDLALCEVLDLPASARTNQESRYVEGRKDAGRRLRPHLQECAASRRLQAPPDSALVPEALPHELNLQGEPVAIVAAETEDLAQDAAEAIEVEYEILPFAPL